MERREWGLLGLKNQLKVHGKRSPVIYIHRISDVHVYQPACAYSSQGPKKEESCPLELTRPCYFVSSSLLIYTTCIWASLKESGYISPTYKDPVCPQRRTGHLSAGLRASHSSEFQHVLDVFFLSVVSSTA